MLILLGITTALVVLVGGCVQDPVTELSDSDHIYILLTTDSTVEMRPLDGHGEDGDGKPANHPEFWFRQLSNEELSYDLILENDPSRGTGADIIDADTMLDQEEDDYDSGAWGIPMVKE